MALVVQSATTWAAKEAVIKLCTLKLARDLYRTFNRKYFGNSLRKDVEIYWASGAPWLSTGRARTFNKKIYAETAWWDLADDSTVISITLSDVLKGHKILLAQALLHEMTHVKLKDGSHGQRFKKAKRRLMRAGAYDRWT